MEISFHEKAVQMLFCVTEQRCLCLGVPAYPSGCAHWSTERARAWFPYDCSVRALGGSGSSAPARIFPGQAARPVPLHQACKGINTTSFSIVGFAFCFFLSFFMKVVLNFSGLCRKFGAFYHRHLSVTFSMKQHLSSFLPNAMLMLQAVGKPFCLQPSWRATKECSSSRSSSQNLVAGRNQPGTATWYQLGQQCPSSCSPV